MGVDNPPGGPDKSPETTDKPTPPETGDTSSHDRPGASGKTPRMDSLAAAGWRFPGRPEAGTGQSGDRDSKTCSSTSAPTRDTPQTQGGPTTEVKPDAREDLESEKADKPEGARQDEDESGNDDRAATTGRPETGSLGAQDDKEPLPQETGSSTGDRTDGPQPAQQSPSRLESLARAREAQYEYAEQLRAKFQDTRFPNDTGQQPLSEHGDQNVLPQSENTGEQEPGSEAQSPVTETPPGGTDDKRPENQTDAASTSGSRLELEETYPVTKEKQRSFEQSQQHLDGLSKKKQLEEVAKGFEKDGQRYKPEAALLKAAKHGVDWSEGMARAIRDGRPQGRFGSAADVQYATECGAELGPKKTGFFRLPRGHNCIEYHPDGTTSTPNSIFVKVYLNGKVHSYPLTRKESS